MTSLCAEHITCRRGGRRLFTALDLTLSGGECLLLTGPNGSGKSSLLDILAGMRPPDEGQITTRPDHIAYLPATMPFLPWRSARKNLKDWAVFTRARPENVTQAINRTGLTSAAEQRFETLSQGQAKRLGLARLLLAPVGLWLLDEPESGLDRDGLALLHELVNEQTKKGGTVIIATHRPDLWLQATAQIDLSPAPSIADKSSGVAA